MESNDCKTFRKKKWELLLSGTLVCIAVEGRRKSRLEDHFYSIVLEGFHVNL